MKKRAENKRRKRLQAARNHHGIKQHSPSQTTASASSGKPTLSSATATASSVITSTTHDTMFSSAGSPDNNPFLPDGQETGLCCESNCSNKALKPLSTCGQHFMAPPAEKASSVRSLVTAAAPPNRKTLDGKNTARKSTTRTPFLPAEARLRHSKSAANSRLPNNHSTSKTSHTKAPEPSRSESPVRKKLRLFSPRDEHVALNPGRSASPLAMPNGVLQGMIGSALSHAAPHQPAKLPTLSPDLRSSNSAATDLDGRQRPIRSYENYLKSPLTAGFGFGGELPKPHADASSSTNRPNRAGSTSSRKSPTKVIPTKVAPTKVIPTRLKPEPKEKEHSLKLSASPKSRPDAITHAHPSEKPRQSLTEKDTSNLDSFVYAQSLQSPPEGALINRAEPRRQESVLYAALDPRTHWMRPHSEAWYQKKEEEIRARGGRKANFGKAAQRMKRERLKGDTLEARLPDRVLENETWVSALRWFDDQSHGGASQNNATPSTPIKPLKRPHKRRQPTSTSIPDEKLTDGQQFGD